MSHRNYPGLLSLVSILLCLYSISSQAEAKCSGQWSLQACMGGNGKRSGMDDFSKDGDAGDSLFLKRLLYPDDTLVESYPDIERNGLAGLETWPEPEQISKDNQLSREGVMYQLQHILGRLRRTKVLRDKVYGDIL